MAMDLVLPREHWLLIHPQDGGVLCANCMIRRASKLPTAINITGLITFADNYHGVLTPYDEVKRAEHLARLVRFATSRRD
ncbi:MAG TPA: hypothetical protein VIF62_34905 [Labilithrix sp.]